jgi:hypothetical protein
MQPCNLLIGRFVQMIRKNVNDHQKDYLYLKFLVLLVCFQKGTKNKHHLFT